MKPSKIRLKRRESQRRIDEFARALEAAALDYAHVTWHPTAYTNAPMVARSRRMVLCEAAVAFTAAVDGEEMPPANVVPLPAKKTAQCKP